MQKVEIKNRSVLNILNKYITYLLDNGIDQDVSVEYKPEFISEDYLVSLLESSEAEKGGKPEHSYSCEVSPFIEKRFKQHPEADGMRYEFEREMIQILGEGTRCALQMYYPKDGYISWHSNKDAPGYNVLFSWSETGDGYFRYYDNATGEYVDMPDDEGWNCKVGYYGDDADPNEIFFHMAETKCPRFTFAFILPDRRAQEKLIQTLSRLV